MTVTQRAEHDLVQIGVRLLDDAYLAWYAAECDSDRALGAWFAATHSGDALYRSYLAAVDREEAAARDLERLSELTRPWRERLSAGTPFTEAGVGA